jgi:peptidyl-prolyl cis-trans isomerase D
MLTAFREFAKSPVAVALIGLLIFCFLFFGIRDVFKTSISNSVITAGSREVTPSDFKLIFDGYKRHVEEQQGEAVPMKVLLANGVDTGLLEQKAADEAFDEYIHKIGVRPADSLISDALLKIPAFFNQANGKFDPKAYADLLAKQNLTKEKYESSLLDSISQTHLGLGLAAGLKAPLAYGALVSGFQLEGRNVSYFKIDPASVPAVAPPTDAQLLAFEKAQQLQQPEMRTLTVVRFSAKALSAKATVDQAAVQKLFDYQKAQGEQPEKRSVAVIPAKSPAMAQAIAVRLKAGDTPQAAAKAVGVQAIIYNDTIKGGVADPKVADAAFSMKSGEVTGIQGTLGFDVVIVGRITPAQVADIDKMRPELEAQVRANAAAQLAYQAFQKYDDAHSGGASMADAAKAAGVEPVSIGPITAKGQSRTKQPEGVLSEKVLKIAYTLPQGVESEVQDEGSGEYFIVKVDKIAPPQPPSVQDFHAELSQMYIRQETLTRMAAKAEDVLAKTKKGMTFEAAAASVGGQVQHVAGVNRADANIYKSLGAKLAERMFAAKSGEVFAGANEQGLVMVAKIDAIQPSPPAEAARMAGSYRAPVSKQLFQEGYRISQQVARDKVKPKTDLARARLAIGATAADAPPDPAAAKGGKLAQ